MHRRDVLLESGYSHTLDGISSTTAYITSSLPHSHSRLKMWKRRTNVIKIVNEALLKYLGPGYVSSIQGSPDREKILHLDNIKHRFFHLKVNHPDRNKDIFIVPNSSQDRLQFLPCFPRYNGLYLRFRKCTTIIFVFLRIKSNKIHMVSPYLQSNTVSGDEIPCIGSKNITPLLEQKNPEAALVEYIPSFFTLRGLPNREAFEWKQIGRNEGNIQIAKVINGKDAFWKFTEIYQNAVVVDNIRESLSARLDRLLDITA